MSTQKTSKILCIRLFICLSLIFISPILGTETAQAQATEFQLQRFRPWQDPDGMWQAQSGKTLGQWNYLAALIINYAKDPLLIRRADGTKHTSIVGHQVGADLTLGLGLLNWLNVELSMPITLYQNGTIPDFSTFGSARNRPVTGFAASDLKLGIKAQFLQQEKHFLDMGLKLTLSLPTGDTAAFNGADGVGFGIGWFNSKRFGLLRIALNLGYRNQPETQLHTHQVQHELLYALGLSLPMATDKLEFILDLSGSTALSGELSIDSIPLEFLAGIRYYPLPYMDLALNFAAGAGLSLGFGTPQFRILFGLSWSPKKKDTDGDGIYDRNDGCPITPGPKENKGCPWPDTDGDGLIDRKDRCPRKVGPRENQGCPWPDTDKDGLFDKDDSCPKKAGPKANKGCPWPDTDKDGLFDKDDKCPKKAGPKANKGCPWPDTDKDGVTDNIDKCPEIKGTKKKEGCPEVILVKVTQKEIKILQKIFFVYSRATIKKNSYPILMQVLDVLRNRPDLRVRIEGHTDNIGSKKYNYRLSRKRARAVRRFLIRKGVSPNRLSAKGFGKSRPLTGNRTKKGRATNRRVEFKIIKKKQ